MQVAAAVQAVKQHLHHHYHRVHPRMAGVRLLKHDASAFPAGSLSIEQVLVAYGFKKFQFAGVPSVKLGIGSLGGGVVQADIDNFVRQYGMLAPKITVLEVGGAKNDPVSDQDSNVENMLDILVMAFVWWWLTGTAADITFCVGPNASNGMELVTAALVRAGVKVGNWSWGSAESTWTHAERAALDAQFVWAVSLGCQFFAAAGDNSADDGTAQPSTDFPCSDIHVVAVGGTNLAVNDDGTRKVEKAWGDGNPGDEGGGGGVDHSIAMPSWQVGVCPGTRRCVPDTSANADPQSGYQVSANGAWTVVGGTSASSPLTAAIMAVVAFASGGATADQPSRLVARVYDARATAFNDVTIGSNGFKAAVGYDCCTGLGTPNAGGLVAAFAAKPAA